MSTPKVRGCGPSGDTLSPSDRAAADNTEEMPFWAAAHFRAFACDSVKRNRLRDAVESDRWQLVLLLHWFTLFGVADASARCSALTAC